MSAKKNPDGLGESRIVNSFNKGNGRVSALPESPKQKKEDGYEGNDENSFWYSDARVGGCDRGDGGAHLVGTRRTEHWATGGRVGVLRGRWIRHLVHGRLGATKGEIRAKTLYEVKSMPLYEVKGGGFYEVKGFGLHFGRFFGKFLGGIFGKIFGKLFGKFGS